MLIKIPASGECRESEVTTEAAYLSRRQILGGVMLSGAAVGLPALAKASERYPGVTSAPAPKWFTDKLASARWQAMTADGEAITPFADASKYNNFYEFGPNKGDPARHASTLKVEPWSVLIDGEVDQPGRYALEELCSESRLEERIYRLRCVEAWSMV
ncbi:MAG: mononuclear molybdenum enzyme YedY, partial [Gammaproteobacteria bacterium]|nr:mononuclear molybdenum enzyme YedY [Gammaproteobacteria bacterium]